MFQTLPIQRPAGEAGVASCPRGRDPGSAVPPGLLEPGMTWYDVIGALPGPRRASSSRSTRPRRPCCGRN